LTVFSRFLLFFNGKLTNKQTNIHHKPRYGVTHKRSSKVTTKTGVNFTILETRFNLLTSNINYIGSTVPLTSKVAFYIFIQQIYVLNILNMVYNLSFFFFSKCSLFHNCSVFGSCIIHILFTGVLKVKKIIPAPKF